MMQTWGRFVARRAWAVLIAGLALVVAAAVFGLGVFDSLSDGGFDDPASDSARSLVKEHATFTSHDADIVVIYSSPSMKVSDPAFRESVSNVIAGLPKGSIERATTWYQTPSPTLVSKDQHATRVILALSGTSQDSKATLSDQVNTHLDAKGLTTTVGGQWAVFHDVNHAVSKDIAHAELISMPIVIILCLAFFGSVTSALMPAFVGGVAIFGAFALVRAITMVTNVSVFAINVITLIGMGLAIDYALFVVSRFREELAKAPGAEREDVDAAITETMATAGRTVFVLRPDRGRLAGVFADLPAELPALDGLRRSRRRPRRDAGSTDPSPSAAHRPGAADRSRSYAVAPRLAHGGRSRCGRSRRGRSRCGRPR